MRLIDIAGPKQRRTCAFAIANNRGLSCGESYVLVSARMAAYSAKISVTIENVLKYLAHRLTGALERHRRHRSVPHVRDCDRKQTELAERKELCARIREKYGLHRAHLVFLANLASLARQALGAEWARTRLGSSASKK